MKRNISAIVASLILIIGVSLLVYPSAAQWVSDFNQSQVTGKYASKVSTVKTTEVKKALEQAKKYNDALKSGAFVGANQNKPSSDGQVDDADGILPYHEQLAAGGGLMSRIRVPSADIDLPIYHGATDEVLLTGAGHLEGTSLPVGGEGTRSVITAHRGMATARMFTDLDKVKKGDTFVLETFGEVLTYRVFDIVVVEPDDSEKIIAVPGKDLVTLITCTPLGINSHRILVTGERIIPTPAADIAQAGKPSEKPGFPMWIVLWIGAIVLVIVTVRYAVYPSPGRAIADTETEEELLGAGVLLTTNQKLMRLKDRHIADLETARRGYVAAKKKVKADYAAGKKALYQQYVTARKQLRKTGVVAPENAQLLAKDALAARKQQLKQEAKQERARAKALLEQAKRKRAAAMDDWHSAKREYRQAKYQPVATAEVNSGVRRGVPRTKAAVAVEEAAQKLAKTSAEYEKLFGAGAATAAAGAVAVTGAAKAGAATAKTPAATAGAAADAITGAAAATPAAVTGAPSAAVLSAGGAAKVTAKGGSANDSFFKPLAAKRAVAVVKPAAVPGFAETAGAGAAQAAASANSVAMPTASIAAPAAVATAPGVKVGAGVVLGKRGVTAATPAQAAPVTPVAPVAPAAVTTPVVPTAPVTQAASVTPAASEASAVAPITAPQPTTAPVFTGVSAEQEAAAASLVESSERTAAAIKALLSPSGGGLAAAYAALAGGQIKPAAGFAHENTAAAPVAQTTSAAPVTGLAVAAASTAAQNSLPAQNTPVSTADQAAPLLPPAVVDTAAPATGSIIVQLHSVPGFRVIKRFKIRKNS